MQPAEYRGDTFSEMEVALVKGHAGITITAAQMRQVLGEQAALIEAKNAAVRELAAAREGK